MIENIIGGEEFLLITINGEMITQNACCNMDKITTLEYLDLCGNNITENKYSWCAHTSLPSI